MTGMGRSKTSQHYFITLIFKKCEDTIHIKTNFFFFFFFGLFAYSRAVPVAYGGSQASRLIGAVVAGLHHSHSNAGSEPRLRPTPQLTATPDP